MPARAPASQPLCQPAMEPIWLEGPNTMSRKSLSAVTAVHADELPAVDALMAATLALMTGCVQTPAGDPNRALMARKLVCQLTRLSVHPQVSPSMRCVLCNLVSLWQPLVNRQTVPEPTLLWHAAPGALQ